jgi:hypothetical protein
MANPIDYFGDISLHGGALKEVAIEEVASLPVDNLVKGRIVLLDGKINYYNGTAWVVIGSSADVTALADRVSTAEGKITTLEGKVTTLEGEMDTAQADITALQNGKIDKTSIVTTLAGTSDDKVPSEKAVKTAIDTAVTGAYKFAGTVATESELASKDKVNGAIYNVTATFTFEGETFEAGTNVVYDSASARWEPLSGIMDTSKFQLIGNLQATLDADATGTKYPNVTAVNAGLALKADKATTYTKTEVDDLLDDKVDKLAVKPTAGTYTKVTINAEGQVTGGQEKIAIADISDIASAEVAVAGKLKTAQNFSISGGATASAVAFDGTGAVELNVTSIDGTKVSGVIPVASVPTITTAKISDFATKVEEVVGAQFKDVSLSTASATGNRYTLTTAGKAFGVMVFNNGVQVFVSTTVTANSIVLDFNSAITPANFSVTYIEEF